MNAMERAHEIRTKAAEKWNCTVGEIIFSMCLTSAWTEKKQADASAWFLANMTNEELENLKAAITTEIDRRTTKTTKVIVNIEKKQTSGRRESWLKTVNSVDDTQKGGYAFEGNFLEEGEVELEVGTIIIECNPRGSVKNWWKEGIIYRVLETGELETIVDEMDWYKEAVSFRNSVAAELKK